MVSGRASFSTTTIFQCSADTVWRCTDSMHRAVRSGRCNDGITMATDFTGCRVLCPYCIYTMPWRQTAIFDREAFEVRCLSSARQPLPPVAIRGSSDYEPTRIASLRGFEDLSLADRIGSANSKFSQEGEQHCPPLPKHRRPNQCIGKSEGPLQLSAASPLSLDAKVCQSAIILVRDA